jgi:hypothetical protein
MGFAITSVEPWAIKSPNLHFQMLTANQGSRINFENIFNIHQSTK